MNKLKENNTLLFFLFDSKYRIWRHVLLILVGAIITFNQVFVAYHDCQGILGNYVYLICLSSWAFYLVAMYFNYFYLTPHFLLKGKYIPYAIILCLLVFLLATLSILEEYWIRNTWNIPHRISSYTNPLILIDNLSSSMITAICFCGISVVLLFRKWVTGNERINQLETDHLKSELNKLKGQIAPTFLSKTLKNASIWAETNPAKATHSLMQLGQLLRYQLYDCNRDKILLKSEINFLTKFMEMERSNRPHLQYRFHVEGDINNVFVSPMLFISLVQHILEDNTSMDLFFKRHNETLSFLCRSDSNRTVAEDKYSLIRKRLELEYPDNYILQSKPGIVELKINVSL